MTSAISATIRPAQPQDLETIVTFIRALAQYEKLEDQVVGNPDELREHLFGERSRMGYPAVEARDALKQWAILKRLVNESKK